MLYGLFVGGHNCGIEGDLYKISNNSTEAFTGFLELSLRHTPCGCNLQREIIEIDIPADSSPQTIAEQLYEQYNFPLRLKPVELDVLYEEGITNHYIVPDEWLNRGE